MNIIRKLKISEIVQVEFTKTEQEIIDLFNDKLSDLIVFIDDSEPDMINYMKVDGSCIMRQDNKNDNLLVKYNGFWSVLQSKFSMKYIDIQILVHSMVERAFNQKVSTPSVIGLNTAELIEIAFNQKVSTPNLNFKRNESRIERAFKQKVSTLTNPKIIS